MNTPIIVFSTPNNKLFDKKYLHQANIKFIEKPFLKEEFLNIIHQIINSDRDS